MQNAQQKLLFLNFHNTAQKMRRGDWDLSNKNNNNDQKRQKESNKGKRGEEISRILVYRAVCVESRSSGLFGPAGACWALLEPRPLSGWWAGGEIRPLSAGAAVLSVTIT